MNKGRHEYKYLCSAAQEALFRVRLRCLMQRDVHADKDGAYRVRSLYFDDADHTCFYENENGTDPREKFRLRIYNADSSRISLECKRKESGKTFKESCTVSETQCRSLMEGKQAREESEAPLPYLLKRVNAEISERRLQPSVIVEYDRVPYVYALGNVRVTFDKNIMSSPAVSRFLEKELPRRGVMACGQEILEVKWDEFLPDYIYRALSVGILQRTTFSKFYLCELYGLKGENYL